MGLFRSGIFRPTFSDSENQKYFLRFFTLGLREATEARLVPYSKVSVSTERQFYQLSDGAKSFKSQALFSRFIASLLVLVI